MKEFVEKDLGPEGLARSVIVVSTSDQPVPMRIRASVLATAIAEDFEMKERKFFMLMDSPTRFAMAQREIGLATGEPQPQGLCSISFFNASKKFSKELVPRKLEQLLRFTLFWLREMI